VKRTDDFISVGGINKSETMGKAAHTYLISLIYLLFLVYAEKSVRLEKLVKELPILKWTKGPF